ncbi:MAG: hypothetical protein J6C46_09565 [Clostridia bacterium]|nr:hypothetical protein [Clostridia bacterium]
MMESISYKDFLNNIKSKCSNPEYAAYVADFVQQGVNTGIITQKNLHYVLSKLQRINLFTSLPPQYRGMYGLTDESQNKDGLNVFINPDLDSHRRKQYAFHELAHVIMDGEQNFVTNNVYNEMAGNISNKDLNYISNGYLVIEEAIAQEISEMFVYSSENRPRPVMTPSMDNAIPNISFYTNHDFYGLYQPLAVAFAKTLRGIGNKKEVSNSQSIYLELLAKRAFNGNFSKDIIDEYMMDNHYVDLIRSFRDMGTVFMVKQATFGVQNGVSLSRENLNASSQAYARAIQNFNMLRDTRPKRVEQEYD